MYEENFYEDIELLGEALKILRHRRNMTQEDLVKKIGISKKYLIEVEKGKHSVGLDFVLRLCKALEVNRFELFALAWEEEYKIYRQKVLKQKDEKQCSSDLTKCLFFFSTIQLRMGIIALPY